MSAQDIANAKNPDLRASVAAMQRAAKLARKVAVQTDTGIVLVQDEKLVHISADELRRKSPEGKNQ